MKSTRYAPLCAAFLFLMTSSTASFAVSDSRDTPSPFGVLAFLDWNHDWNAHMYNTPLKRERAVRMMAEAGVGMVRQVISWDEVEKSRGKFDFTGYDDILAHLEQHDLRMLGVLCYTATWTGKKWNETPDTELFLRYVQKTVARYKDRIKYWELWNEPDQKIYWVDQDQMKSYVALLKAVYPVIKKEDPTAVVVLGSVNTPFPLRDMYRAGAKGHFDIVNVHPFVSPLTSGALGKVKGIFAGVQKVMAEFDDAGKSIWFTELGCPGVEDPEKSAGWWEGQSPTEEQQAQWVETIYGEFLKWKGLDRIFWAFFQESNHFSNAIDNFGLIKKDFTPKPAYHAYQKAANAWTP